MATIKVSLDKRRIKEDDTYPVILRITQNRKSTSISTGISLKEKDWNESTREVRKSNPNHTLLNQKIRKIYATIESRMLNIEINNEPMQRKTLVKPKHVQRETIPNFFEHGYTWVERQQKAGKIGNALVYRNTLTRLKSYLGHERLKFSDIDFDFLEDFQASLLNMGLKRNTVSFHLRFIRSMFNKAMKAKIIEKQYYPFDDFRIRYERTAKRAVSKEVIQKIERLELPTGKPIWNNRNYFLLSFYLRGISFIDLSFLKWTDINDGRLIYKRRKTGKIYNIKLIPKAITLLDYYRNKLQNTPYILPIIPERAAGNAEREQYHTRQGFCKCNYHLKEIATQCCISEKLTTYVSRHSFATIAKMMGFSKDLIAEALGHQSGNKITEIYLDHYDNAVIDEMAEKVTS